MKRRIAQRRGSGAVPALVGLVLAFGAIALTRPTLAMIVRWAPSLPNGAWKPGAAPVPVPEPSSLWLLVIALGLYGVALLFAWCLCVISARDGEGAPTIKTTEDRK